MCVHVVRRQCVMYVRMYKCWHYPTTLWKPIYSRFDDVMFMNKVCNHGDMAYEDIQYDRC